MVLGITLGRVALLWVNKKVIEHMSQIVVLRTHNYVGRRTTRDIYLYYSSLRVRLQPLPK